MLCCSFKSSNNINVLSPDFGCMQELLYYWKFDWGSWLISTHWLQAYSSRWVTLRALREKMIGKGSVWWLTYAIIAGGPSYSSKSRNMHFCRFGQEGYTTLNCFPSLIYRSQERIDALNFTKGSQWNAKDRARYVFDDSFAPPLSF